MKRTASAAAARRADGPAVGAAFRRRARRLLGDPDGPGRQRARRRRSWRCRSCSTCSSTPIWLKPRTPQNIVIGGAAGAFPPLIGWAAATGDVCAAAAAAVRARLPVDAAAFLGAGAVREDRLRQCRHPDAARRGGRARDAAPDRALHHPDGGGGDRALAARAGRRRSTARSAIVATGVVRAGWRAGRDAHARRGDDAMRPEKRLFAYSIVYLFVLFGALVVDRWLRMTPERTTIRPPPAAQRARMRAWRSCSARSSILIFAMSIAKIRHGARAMTPLTASAHRVARGARHLLHDRARLGQRAALPHVLPGDRAQRHDRARARARRARSTAPDHGRVRHQCRAARCNGTSRPKRESDTVDIGARDMAFFTATNTSNRTITGTATFNVTPAQAGKYFTKIQCFCFTQQTLQARRDRADAGDLLRRSRDPEGPGRARRPDDHAQLHVLPGGFRQKPQARADATDVQTREPTMAGAKNHDYHILPPEHRGRSSARSPRWRWRRAASCGCTAACRPANGGGWCSSSASLAC